MACTGASQRSAEPDATPDAANSPIATSPEAPPTESQPSSNISLEDRGTQAACQFVESGYGPTGQVEVRAEEVVSGLEVPWGIVFLEDGNMLVSERPGRIRLVQDGQLQPEPVATVNVSASGEGGLLDIEAHPDFASNRQFYVYYTADRESGPVNLVERWQLSPDGQTASPDRVIVDNIPVARYHNGGRLQFGPDGMLYVGTGDATDPSTSQDPDSLAGKILRVTPEGEIPGDNPFAGSPAYIIGIRNTQGFDWFNQSALWVTDHGPSSELGRRGQDNVSLAIAGDNLGWPTLQDCQTQPDLVSPALVWQQAVPPGGAAVYTGDAIPEWKGSLLIGTLGSEHLHRVVFDPEAPYQVQTHEVYFGDGSNSLGRLRDVTMGPDNQLYVTTSNCDGRGNCPPEGDRILRITR
ncbi:MAG: PQQ-dependent sugar dehydrogenase [Elainellaceae cyanobacterium]